MAVCTTGRSSAGSTAREGADAAEVDDETDLTRVIRRLRLRDGE